VILAAEAMALAGPVPACVVRLGYRYGPDSADLRADRSACRLGRPCGSGEPRAGQHHLHHRAAADAGPFPQAVAACQRAAMPSQSRM
jgi:hypothetical protein